MITGKPVSSSDQVNGGPYIPNILAVTIFPLAGGCSSSLTSCLPSPPFCSKSSGSAALLALSWTCLLVRIVFPLRAKRQGDIWNKLVGSSGLQSSDGQLSVQNRACSSTFSMPRAFLSARRPGTLNCLEVCDFDRWAWMQHNHIHLFINYLWATLSGMRIGTGNMVTSKRNVVSAFVVYVEDMTGQRGEDSQKTSNP